jgi:hypothetical protein
MPNLYKIYTVNLLCITVYITDLVVKVVKLSENIVFKGKNGGSGWTRTTDLTLIRGAL